MPGGKYQKAIEAALENVPMVTAPEEKDDDELRYTAARPAHIDARAHDSQGCQRGTQGSACP